MTNQRDKPGLSDILAGALERGQAKIRTILPGRVLEYDHEKQRATVQPTIRVSYQNPDNDERETELPAPIANCPVSFPSGDEFAITWPLKKNDEVELRFCSHSIDEWLTSGSADNEPQDRRRFDWQDCIVYPGLRSFAHALSEDRLSENAMVLSCGNKEIHLAEADPSDWIALASKVESELSSMRSTLNSLISLYNSHVHTQTMPLIPIAPSPVSSTPSQASSHGNIGDVGSDKVRSG